MKIVCDACEAKYIVADNKVQKAMVRLTCQKCGHTIIARRETGDEAASASTFPAKLAVELFESDDALTRVYTSQNVVIVARSGGWTEDATSSISKVVEEFFLFYPEG